ncbi:hypothetical protein HOY82DRAFT_541845 [Tuber indicum]|nr:hypothetical protein HOY82DRAFT_541845 [Tuber indicum]
MSACIVSAATNLYVSSHNTFHDNLKVEYLLTRRQGCTGTGRGKRERNITSRGSRNKGLLLILKEDLTDIVSLNQKYFVTVLVCTSKRFFMNDPNTNCQPIRKEDLTDTVSLNQKYFIAVLLIRTCDWYQYLGIHNTGLLAVPSTTYLYVAREEIGRGNLEIKNFGNGTGTLLRLVAGNWNRGKWSSYYIYGKALERPYESIIQTLPLISVSILTEMNGVRKENTRGENGHRAEAESLLLRFNKALSCPGCGACNIDCAGKKDEHGRRYRRFVCRVTPGCKKSIGVTEFLQICRSIMEKSSLCSSPTIVASENQPEPSQLPSTRLHINDLPTLKHTVETPQLSHSIPILDPGVPNTDPGICSTEWKDYISADIEYKKEQAKATKELWDEIFILCNELHQARQDILDLKYQLSETCPRSNNSTTSSATFQQSFIKADTTMNGSCTAATSLPFLPHPNEDIAAVELSRSSLPIQHNAKSTYSSVLRQDKPGLEKTKEGDHLTRKPLEKKRVTTSTPLYLEGIPHIPIAEVKELLKAGPIRIQLRHIRNISWIDRHIVELLVDTNHLVHIRNRLDNHSKYKVNRSFDPLKPSSFNWEGDPLPESQEAVLKRNFVERLAASIASSTNHATRQHVMSWSQNRGLGTQLKDQLNKRGIQISQSPINNIAVTPAVNTTCHKASQNSSFTSPDTIAYQTSSSRKRRLSLTADFTP